MDDWKDTAMEESDVLDLMIREMVKNEDRIPTQLVEPVGNILMILSDIEVYSLSFDSTTPPTLTSFAVVESE